MSRFPADGQRIACHGICAGQRTCFRDMVYSPEGHNLIQADLLAIVLPNSRLGAQTQQEVDQRLDLKAWIIEQVWRGTSGR
jgi:hypothetical protein